MEVEPRRKTRRDHWKQQVEVDIKWESTLTCFHKQTFEIKKQTRNQTNKQKKKNTTQKLSAALNSNVWKPQGTMTWE